MDHEQLQVTTVEPGLLLPDEMAHVVGRTPPSLQKPERSNDARIAVGSVAVGSAIMYMPADPGRRTARGSRSANRGTLAPIITQVRCHVAIGPICGDCDNRQEVRGIHQRDLGGHLPRCWGGCGRQGLHRRSGGGGRRSSRRQDSCRGRQCTSHRRRGHGGRGCRDGGGSRSVDGRTVPADQRTLHRAPISAVPTSFPPTPCASTSL